MSHSLFFYELKLVKTNTSCMKLKYTKIRGGVIMRIALTGNPNSGKTTMYNALTGRNEKVGNWAGVTVERKVLDASDARQVDVALEKDVEIRKDIANVILITTKMMPTLFGCRHYLKQLFSWNKCERS